MHAWMTFKLQNLGSIRWNTLCISRWKAGVLADVRTHSVKRSSLLSIDTSHRYKMSSHRAIKTQAETGKPEVYVRNQITGLRHRHTKLMVQASVEAGRPLC